MTSPITPDHIRRMKAHGEKIAVLTAYDYPLAKMLDEQGIPLILIGDSLGMVVLGHPDTTHVTMEDMVHHTKAVARARQRAALVADLPFGSYDTPEQAVTNAQRLITAGADAVKAEGGRSILPQVQAIRAAGIPYLGHLGMLPQHVLEEGGYRVKGKSEPEHAMLMEDAQALADAGAFGIVLELITPPVARELSALLPIPTIGIGSGPDCDGQVLVIHDLIGMFPWFKPRFATQLADCSASIRSAVTTWKQSVTRA